MLEASHDPGAKWNQPPDPLPAISQKPWWSVYRYSLGSLIFIIFFITGDQWFVHGNPPPKSLNELEMQTVEVVDWRINGSRLYVRLPTGVVRQVEFPSLNFREPRLYQSISFEEQKALIGQRCQMWGRPLRRVPDDRFQVFALQCNGGGLPFQVALKNYRIVFDVASGRVGSWLFFAFTLPLLITLFLMEYFQNKRLNKQGGRS